MNVPHFKSPILAALVATHAAAFLIGYAVWPSPSAGPPAPANVPAVAEASHQGRPKRDARQMTDKRITDFPAEMELLSQAEMSREEFVKARDELLVKWMHRDLGAVLDWCYGSAAHTNPVGTVAFSGALWRQIAAQGSEVMQWINAGRFGSNRQAVFSQWCAALRANGKGDLYFSEMPNMTLAERVWLISNHAFNELDLPGLTAFRDELGRYAAEDRRDGDHLLMMYASRLVELSWENPAAVFQGESDPALLRHFGRIWADKRFGRDPDPEKLSDITGLPPAARGGVLYSVLNSADERGVAGVLPVFKELVRLECWEDLRGEEAARAMRDVAALGRDAALALTKWVATLDHPEARRPLTTAAARGFVAKDEKGCLEWLTAMPSGPELDATIASLTSDYVGTREFKLGLLEKVHDPALAARLIASDSRLRSADGAR